jgi:RNA polymerase sigma-70 factor (ECF subfamily)
MAKNSLATAARNQPVDEANLLDRACGGDMDAFSRLVARYQDRILNTCWRMCGNLEDARDLTQEAFLHALRGLGSFDRRAGFYTWLFRIAVNLALSHRRKAVRRPKLSLHDGEGQFTGDQQGMRLVGRVSDDSPDPASTLSRRERERIVMEMLDELDDDHRSVLVLRDIEGFDYQQIADILEVAVGTVKSRIHRARMELRERLRPILGDAVA